MNVKSENLSQQLQSKLYNSYLFFGTEILLLDENISSLRKITKEQEFERVNIDIDTLDSWGELSAIIGAPSLFSQKRLIECRIKKKINAQTSKLLVEVLTKNTDDILLFIADKLDKYEQKSKWVNAIDNNGIVVQHYEVQNYQLQSWISSRMQSMGLLADKDIVQLIAFYTEGNLLATQQELIKLKLTFPDGKIDAKSYQSQLEQQSKYSVFGLIDASLKGDASLIYKIHTILKQEDTPIPLIIGALNKEIKQLIDMAIKLRLQMPMANVLAEFKVWNNKKSMTEQTLSRLSYGLLQKILMHLGRVDRSMKGLDNLIVWDELLNICLTLSGRKLWIQ